MKREKTFVAIGIWKERKQLTKRPDLIIDSLSIVQNLLGMKFRLIMIGDGDMIPQLSMRAEKVDLKVDFKGWLSKQQIATILRRADYLIHASNVETFGMTIAEALCLGVPVIASNVGAVPELVNDNNGVLVQNDMISWEKGIVRLIETQYDRAGMAEDYSCLFSYSEVGRTIDSIYQKATT